DCDHFAPAAAASRELRAVWPALTIVSWPGTRTATGFKLLPFTVPPFRMLVRNEAGDFFPARPGLLLNHAARRTRDAAKSAAIRLGEWAGAIPKFLWSPLWRLSDRMASLTLAFLAILAPLVWPLALAAFKRRTGESHLNLQLPSIEGSSITEILVGDRRWRRARIAEALQSAQSTFLVFRHPTCAWPVEPLLHLALQTDAFAVAHQVAYTGWRERISTRHPFRTLQAGEIASVFGPVSPLLVIRRDALDLFGLPRAITFGAALQLLYWRAAAAGLNSFVLGDGQKLNQEPAMALEDVEFALRLIPLAPRFPELRRGNIATNLLLAPGFRGKPRVLVVSPYLPFPLSHGGAVRIYNLCRELSPHIDFILACFREAKETVFYEDLYRVFREIYVVDSDEKVADPTVPQQVHEYRNSAMSALVGKLCQERGVQLLQLEYTQMAEYRARAGPLPVLLVEHDITFSLHRQLNTPQFPLWHKFEHEALQSVAAVWTMSGQDRALALETGAPAVSTTVISNGVDLHRFQPAQKTSQAPTILFVGSFRHLPNLLAYEALCLRILPGVRNRIPNVHLHVIAGPDHQRAAQLAGKASLLAPSPGITMQGFVEDVRPAYRECDVVVIPLPVSAGTNIKLMEAMACARAVVSTPVGCIGLDLRDGHDLLIRDLGPDFAAAVANLLEDTPTRSALTTNARQTAEDRFGWDAIARDALQSYAALGL
ncbi:MAG TPA: glycosyltransferase family 4 protein, partial [Bryobacteraceae bacterium]|nr:glycosyltransferase family 4 protein [Bryobacteraceae bacterium]